MTRALMAATALLLAGGAAEAAPAPEIDACQASGLIALKQHAPATKSVTIDPDTASVSKVDLMVEQARVHAIVLGLATIDTAKAEKPHQFVCLLGDKGKVLLTFFTAK